MPILSAFGFILKSRNFILCNIKMWRKDTAMNKLSLSIDNKSNKASIFQLILSIIFYVKIFLYSIIDLYIFLFY